MFTEAASLSEPDNTTDATPTEATREANPFLELFAPDSPLFTRTRIGSASSFPTGSSSPPSAEQAQAFPPDAFLRGQLSFTMPPSLDPSPSVRIASMDTGQTEPLRGDRQVAAAALGNRPGPKSPHHVPVSSWALAFRRAVSSFMEQRNTDVAAGLTYYGVLSIFPALLALTSIFSLIGRKRFSVDTLMNQAADAGVLNQGTLDTLRGPLDSVINSPAAGIMLLVGLLGALWSASGYVGAFGRAMNVTFQQAEGRGIVRLRGQQLLITATLLVLVVLVTVGLVVSGPVAEQVGSWVGLSHAAVTIWGYSKLPVMGLLVVAIVALLYYGTPNVRLTSWRWVSVGAVLAVLLWGLASVGFALYVRNFGSYDKTYGSLAGVIVFLLWLWISNCAFLFGAQLDAELERARQLHSGIAAEVTLQLTPRETKGAQKAQVGRQQLIEKARQIREDAELPTMPQRPSTTDRPPQR